MEYLRLQQYLNRYIRSSYSVDSYLYEIRRFIDRNPGYTAYTHADITRVFAELNEQYHRKDGTVSGAVNRIFISIKWLYSFLVYTGIRKEHPFPPGYSIKGTQKKGFDRSTILSPKELSGLVTYARQEELRFPWLQMRNAVVISILVYQGLLSQELVALLCEDIDLDAGTMKIRSTRITNGRVLPLHPSQFMLLHDYLNQSRQRLLRGNTTCQHLILSTRALKETVNGIGSILRRYRFLYPDKPMTAENIRKSVIYNKINEEQRSVEEVQLFAGHKWPSSTEAYRSEIDFNDTEFINEVHPMEGL
ncbi:tyrosine-type recombinase/integrase [Flavobacterium sp.]|uniref:tyrosine-type recombinase/integrase n=1 Tax=Flavobacterium sp. TaxID=239 RepID=UPI00403424C7